MLVTNKAIYLTPDLGGFPSFIPTTVKSQSFYRSSPRDHEIIPAVPCARKCSIESSIINMDQLQRHIRAGRGPRTKGMASLPSLEKGRLSICEFSRDERHLCSEVSRFAYGWMRSWIPPVVAFAVLGWTLKMIWARCWGFWWSDSRFWVVACSLGFRFEMSNEELCLDSKSSVAGFGGRWFAEITTCRREVLEFGGDRYWGNSFKSSP